jgi:general secretion pathway protein N
MVRWHNAASALSAVRPLGEYRARITGSLALGEFRIETLNGILHVQGGGSWTRATGISFEVTARASTERRLEIAPLLDQIGPDLGDGIRRLAIVGLR